MHAKLHLTTHKVLHCVDYLRETQDAFIPFIEHFILVDFWVLQQRYVSATCKMIRLPSIWDFIKLPLVSWKQFNLRFDRLRDGVHMFLQELFTGVL
jgi:hypothetical protein